LLFATRQRHVTDDRAPGVVVEHAPIAEFACAGSDPSIAGIDLNVSSDATLGIEYRG
jgi:hypothetical protein